MPLYEYECQKCKKRFEKIQSFSDPILKKCIYCGGSVKKLISSAAIQFKGSGWYVTDYSRKGKSAEAKEEAAEKKKESEKRSESSDTKSAPNKEKATAKPKEK